MIDKNEKLVKQVSDNLMFAVHRILINKVNVLDICVWFAVIKMLESEVQFYGTFRSLSLDAVDNQRIIIFIFERLTCNLIRRWWGCFFDSLFSYFDESNGKKTVETTKKQTKSVYWTVKIVNRMIIEAMSEIDVCLFVCAWKASLLLW